MSQDNLYRIMYLEGEVVKLNTNQKKLQETLEQNVAFVHLLVKLVNEQKEEIKLLKGGSPVGIGEKIQIPEIPVVKYPVVARMKIENITFPESLDMTVTASSIRSRKRDWYTITSNEILPPGRYEITMSIDSSERSGIMFGFVKSDTKFSKGEFIGRKGWGFHCMNGKKAEDNIFMSFADDVEGLEGGEKVTFVLDSSRGELWASVNSGGLKLMYEKVDFGNVRFAISMNGNNSVHVDNFEDKD